MTVFIVGTNTNAPGIGALSFANSQSQSSGTIFFSNANNVQWGLTNGVVTASVSALGAVNLSIGTTSTNATQIIFSNGSNANNVSFGLSGNVITGVAPVGAGGAPTYTSVVVDNAPGTLAGGTGNNYGPSTWNNAVNTLLKVYAATGGTTIYSLNMTGYSLGDSFFLRNISPTDQLLLPISGGTLAYSISNISQATSAVVTVTTTGQNPFSVGNTIGFTSVVGMTQINNTTGTVTAIGGTSGAYTATVNINSTNYSAYSSGGTATISNAFTFVSSGAGSGVSIPPKGGALILFDSDGLVAG